jgi:hypothetical protein
MIEVGIIENAIAHDRDGQSDDLDEDGDDDRDDYLGRSKDQTYELSRE